METPALYARRIESRIAESLQDAPVVLLAGPRQAGKTTLVRQIAADNGLRYLTLDDELTLLSAREDPVGMIRSLDRAVIDEIQRAWPVISSRWEFCCTTATRRCPWVMASGPVRRS